MDLNLQQREIMGERIKERRKHAGLSQGELGDKIKVTYATISKYESGLIKSIDANILNNIAKATNTDINYLLGNTSTPNPIDEPVAIAASTKNGIDLSEVDDEDKEAIMRFIEMAKNKNKK